MNKSAVVDRSQLIIKKWDDKDLLLRIRWNGVNFYEFVLPNGKTIIMDPYFDDGDDGHNEHNYTPTSLSAGEWVNGADLILITHGHFDHTGELASVLERYPDAHIIIPEHALPSVLVELDVNFFAHRFTTAGAHDRFKLLGVDIETVRSNHNIGKGGSPTRGKTEKYYIDENGKEIEFFKLWKWIYERELMNMRITTEDGFSVLIWNSEMGPDGIGFETRPYFYENAKPDLFMYQVAGASFGGNRRNPDCGPMGRFIASVKAKSAIPEHQQHFAYDELDNMAGKFADICNESNVATSFLTPCSGVWYGYAKNENDDVEVYLLEK